MGTLQNDSGTVCRYNGFDFNALAAGSGLPTVLTTGINVKPVYDQAGRTVVYSEYDLTLQAWVFGQPTDAAVQSAVRLLTVPAGVLEYENKGVGGLVVNTGRIKDVMWGPRPQLVGLDVGGKNGNATRITWRVTVCIPTCADARFAFAAMEFNFSVAVDVGASGLSSRTYAGHIRIPQTRSKAGARQLTDTADAYREKVVPTLPPGFRREHQNFELDEAKTTCRFTVVDVQMGKNIPPPGVIEITGPGMRYGSSPQEGMEAFTGSASLTYKLAATTPVNVAINHFRAYVIDRSRGLGDKFIPMTHTLAEPNPYGPDRLVELGMGFSAVVPLRQLLINGGLWRPAGQDWQAWASSMRVTLGPRGEAGLVFHTGDDAIVDLCGTETINTLASNRTGQPSAAAVPPAGYFPTPSPESSYLRYRNSVRVEVDNGIMILKTLPAKQGDVTTLSSGPSSSATQSLNGAGAAGGKSAGPARSDAVPPGVAKPLDPFYVPSFTATPKPGAGPYDYLNNSRVGWSGGFLSPPARVRGGKPGKAAVSAQARVSPTIRLVMEGFAIRAGYPVSQPQLVDVGGVTPIPTSKLDRGEGFVQAVIGNAGVPVYGARWRLSYTLEDAPDTDAPIPPNPLYDAQVV